MAVRNDVAPSLLEIEIRRIVREELAAMRGVDSDPLMPHDEIPGHTPRAGAEAMRSGKIHGATKTGKKWYARRSAVEKYIASGIAHRDIKPANDVEAAVERALRRAR